MSNVNRKRFLTLHHQRGSREDIIVEIFYTTDNEDMTSGKGEIILNNRNRPFHNLTPDARLCFTLEEVTWPSLSTYVYSKKIPDSERKKMLNVQHIGFQLVCNENTLTNEMWKNIKVSVMAEGLLSVFTHHRSAIQLLLDTGVRIIKYNGGSNGNFWGIGNCGTGKNIYGKLLMEMRRLFARRYGSVAPLEASYTKEDVDLLVSSVSEIIIESPETRSDSDDYMSAEDAMICDAEPMEGLTKENMAKLREANKDCFSGFFGSICNFKVYYLIGRVIVYLRMDAERVKIGVFPMEIIQKHPDDWIQWLCNKPPYYKIVNCDDPGLNTALLWELLNCEIEHTSFKNVAYQNEIYSKHRTVFSEANKNVFDGTFGKIGRMRLYRGKDKKETDRIIVSVPATDGVGNKFFVIGSFHGNVIENQPNPITHEWMIKNAIRIVHSASNNLDNVNSLVIYLLGL